MTRQNKTLTLELEHKETQHNEVLKNLVQRHREEVADNNRHNYDKLKAIQVKMAARDSEYVHALAEKEADFERRFSE